MAHLYAKEVLQPGEAAIDATAGNGRDTLFLARLVGPAGRVYAFDVQEEALERTRAMLQQENLQNRVRLIKCGHEDLLKHVHEPVALVMFNLGYLPGGDHRIVTAAGTTLAAVRSALELLKRGGMVALVVYPGHPGGKEEQEALTCYCSRLNSREYRVVSVSYLNQAHQPPALILIYRC